MPPPPLPPARRGPGGRRGAPPPPARKGAASPSLARSEGQQQSSREKPPPPTPPPRKKKPAPPPPSMAPMSGKTPGELNNNDLAGAMSGLASLLSTLRSDDVSSLVPKTGRPAAKKAPPPPLPSQNDAEVGNALTAIAGIIDKLGPGANGTAPPANNSNGRTSRDIMSMFKKRQEQRLAGNALKAPKSSGAILGSRAKSPPPLPAHLQRALESSRKAGLRTSASAGALLGTRKKAPPPPMPHQRPKPKLSDRKPRPPSSTPPPPPPPSPKERLTERSKSPPVMIGRTATNFKTSGMNVSTYQNIRAASSSRQPPKAPPRRRKDGVASPPLPTISASPASASVSPMSSPVATSGKMFFAKEELPQARRGAPGPPPPRRNNSPREHRREEEDVFDASPPPPPLKAREGPTLTLSGRLEIPERRRPSICVSLDKTGIRGVIEFLVRKDVCCLPEIFIRPVQAADVRDLFDKIKGEKSPAKLWTLLDASDVHVVSSVLKLHFRSMRVPAIPFELYDTLVLAATSGSTDDALAMEIRPILQGIASDAKDSLVALISFLSTIESVTSARLAYTWGPSLMWPRKETIETMMTGTKAVNRITHVMITRYGIIFGDALRGRTATAPSAGTHASFNSQFVPPSAPPTPQMGSRGVRKAPPPPMRSRSGSVSSRSSSRRMSAPRYSYSRKRGSSVDGIAIRKGGPPPPPPRKESKTARRPNPPAPAHAPPSATPAPPQRPPKPQHSSPISRNVPPPRPSKTRGTPAPPPRPQKPPGPPQRALPSPPSRVPAPARRAPPPKPPARRLPRPKAADSASPSAPVGGGGVMAEMMSNKIFRKMSATQR